MISRGIRNNNPGNLDKGDDWQGLADEQPDPRFCTFISPLWGIRALAKVLLTYQRKHNKHTIREIISRWAPPHENDTEAYIKAVSAHVHVIPDAPISLEDRTTMFLLVEAIIKHENGQQPYSGDVIHSALSAAGIH